MSGFYSYDDWKCTPPPEDDGGEEMAREEYEQRLAQQEQEEFDQGAIECDERAPWPGELDPPPAFCPRCNRTHVRSGEAEERCQEVSRFIAQDHRRRGGEG